MFETTIIGIFIIGIGFLLYLILRDPIFMFKSFLRGLKADSNWRLKILFFPIWGPTWLIDKIFGLKLYIKEFEEASNPQTISFSEYNKYLLINTSDLVHIENILKSFQNEYDPKDYKYSLNGSRIKISEFDENVIVKFEQEIEFASMNALIQYIDNSAPQNKVYNAKGIFLNTKNRANSYFIFFDTAFPLRLIGKTYKNKKMYVDLYSEIETKELIYLNSNMDYFKNFDFDKFENEISRLRYMDLEIKPST